jgi:hypothetical protein
VAAVPEIDRKIRDVILRMSNENPPSEKSLTDRVAGPACFREFPVIARTPREQIELDGYRENDTGICARSIITCREFIGRKSVARKLGCSCVSVLARRSSGRPILEPKDLAPCRRSHEGVRPISDSIVISGSEPVCGESLILAERDDGMEIC